ncbi:MAG: glycosyltransferase [Acidobacteriota bacterium]|nr:glycosyltransferase [Acidobacteriota bacterium]
MSGRPLLAYLCSKYPAVSHTFISREIRGLKTHDIPVQPFSMRPGEVLPGADDWEKEQLASTWCIHGQGLWSVLTYQVIQFLRFPLGYLRGLLFALALQKGRPKESLWALFHFLEGAMLARQMGKRGLSHVHVHFAGPESAVALYASRAFGITYSFTLHGPDVFYKVEIGNLAAKMRHASFIACISHFATSQVLRILGSEALAKTHIVHCGVDPGQFAPVHRTASFEDEPFTIVCTGRLTSTKGQALLIKACVRLAEENRRFRCVLIGSGDEWEALKRLVAEHGLENSVVLTGALPQEGVRRELAKADLFVLPSFAEGVPVVLMEAMSMEIPCITTRVGGIAELIDDGVNGWLLHAGDLDALADNLKARMDASEELAEIGRKARVKIQEAFHIEKCTQGLAEIFRQRLG